MSIQRCGNCGKGFRRSASSLACSNRSCSKEYHYRCALDAGCVFVDDSHDRIFCSEHVPLRNSKRPRRSSSISTEHAYDNDDDDDLEDEVVEDAAASADVYEVEKILQRRRNKKHTVYLVKWQGFPMSACTWEPEENFLDRSVIDAFEATHVNSTKRITGSSREGETEMRRKARRRNSSSSKAPTRKLKRQAASVDSVAATKESAADLLMLATGARDDDSSPVAMKLEVQIDNHDNNSARANNGDIGGDEQECVSSSSTSMSSVLVMRRSPRRHPLSTPKLDEDGLKLDSQKQMQHRQDHIDRQRHRVHRRRSTVTFVPKFRAPLPPEHDEREEHD